MYKWWNWLLSVIVNATDRTACTVMRSWCTGHCSRPVSSRAPVSAWRSCCYPQRTLRCMTVAQTHDHTRSSTTCRRSWTRRRRSTTPHHASIGRHTTTLTLHGKRRSSWTPATIGDFLSVTAALSIATPAVSRFNFTQVFFSVIT